MILTFEIQPYCLVSTQNNFLTFELYRLLKHLSPFSTGPFICVYPVIAALALPRVLPTLVRSRWAHPTLTTSHSAIHYDITCGRRQHIRSHFLDYISLSRGRTLTTNICSILELPIPCWVERDDTHEPYSKLLPRQGMYSALFSSAGSVLSVEGLNYFACVELSFVT